MDVTIIYHVHILISGQSLGAKSRNTNNVGILLSGDRETIVFSEHDHSQ